MKTDFVGVDTDFLRQVFDSRAVKGQHVMQPIHDLISLVLLYFIQFEFVKLEQELLFACPYTFYQYDLLEGNGYLFYQ